MEVPNVEACFAISVRFKGEGGGLRMKLTFFVSQASANFCDGPLTARFFRKRRRADRQHELQQSSRGFRLGFDRLRDKDRKAHTCHVHAKGQQRTALMFAGAIRQSPA